MGEKFKFSFKVVRQWRTLPFNRQLYNKLNNSLTDVSLIYNMDKYSDDPYETLPEWPFSHQ